jgi:cytoskeletal protein CcmA (bactofilin family)
VFVSGPSASTSGSAGRDLLAFGASVSVSGDVAEDVHAMGFDVDVQATIGGDLVAAGASVRIDGPVRGDVTASAMTLRTGIAAAIGGNARLAAATVTVDGPVDGALTAAGADITLNAPVSGDVMLAGASITFGPDARIDGTLRYVAEEPIAIPERVISADRVRFEQASEREMWQDFREDWEGWDSPVNISPFGIVAGFLVNLGLFILIGAIFLSLAPGMIRSLRREADARPGMVMLTGAIGLSILFGIVPVALLSIVGLPVIPILLLLILAAWALGYILGAYVVALRVMRGLGGSETPTMVMRLLALAIGVTIAALLNFIPVIGWMANFALVLLGVGAITIGLFYRMFDRFGAERDQALAPLDTPQS